MGRDASREDPQCVCCGKLFQYLANETCGKCSKKTAHPDQANQINSQPQCLGCGGSFEQLDTTHCSRCTKRSQLASSADVDNTSPQCLSCGIVYKFLEPNSLCGRCTTLTGGKAGKMLAPDAIPRAITSKDIASRGMTLAASATAERVNPKRNRTVNDAATAAVKTKVSQMKDQRTMPSHKFDVQLFYYSSRQKVAKVVEGAMRIVCETQKTVGSVMREIVLVAKKLYAPIPQETRKLLPFQADVFESGLSDRLAFYIATGRGVGHVISIEEVEHLTVRSWLEKLENFGMMTDKSRKEKVLPVNISVLWKATFDSDDAFEDDDLKSAAYSVRRYDSKLKSPIRNKPHAAGVKRKRPADSASTVADHGRPSTRIQPSAGPSRYVSSYQIPSSAAVTYTAYRITTTTCIVDVGGAISNAVSTSEDTIYVARDWKRDLNHAAAQELDAYGTFIGRGRSKFAFMGHYQGRKYAILQIGPYGFITKPELLTWSNEEENGRDLLNELQLLVLGQYFADSFARRAECSGVSDTLPKIRFNSVGAFVGTLKHSDDDGAELNLTCRDVLPGTPPLFWKTFLAVPYIDSSDGYVASFVHKERSEIILIDPQAHTDNWPGKNAFWDHGKPEIERFEKNHKCNAICKKLELRAPTARTTGQLTVTQLCDRKNGSQ
ncbi:hypothetical protein EIP91_005064 [Steccherinum ochraceum]|uniref:Alpha-type protein kinase domain-containing protein n=1 Tax=Steccherinum ochraceum TaxID=92696 RepID=A0A4R0RS97_9APHY|nr:hypothetical protein EIP91_005064 [Steccherinum ochraceum]